MGVLAIVPLVAFFGFGVLNKDDFNGFLWNVVMLAMGGLALGEAVQSSGLLLEISTVSGTSVLVTRILHTDLGICVTGLVRSPAALSTLPNSSGGRALSILPRTQLLYSAELHMQDSLADVLRACQSHMPTAASNEDAFLLSGEAGTNTPGHADVKLHACCLCKAILKREL